MLGSRFRLGLLAEHQQVLVDGLVRRELAPSAPQVLPLNDGLPGQRTKGCENARLIQWSGSHARVSLKRGNRLGKPGMGQPGMVQLRQLQGGFKNRGGDGSSPRLGRAK